MRGCDQCSIFSTGGKFRPVLIFTYWREISPWLWAYIGVTHSYSSHSFLCALERTQLCGDATVKMLLSHYTNLVPRPHPLTRRNSLVNQIKFLGLAHAFVTVQHFVADNPFKNSTDTQMEMNKFHCFKVLREVLCVNTDLSISLVLTTFEQ